jgi:hypothetical protein
MTRLLLLLFILLLCLGPLGCGSKISEANYYRVQYGMSEEDVEDLLGPHHGESVEAATPATSSGAPATSRPVWRVKTWSRGELVIQVSFENGLVAGRSARGIAGETPRPAATVPVTGASTPAD